MSVGELFDKITILKIKSLKIYEASKLANVARELSVLEQIVKASGIEKNSIYEGLMFELYEINNAL
jgi:hypothetical protein